MAGTREVAFERIKKLRYTVPATVPRAAKELIGLLLKKNPVRMQCGMHLCVGVP